MDNLSEMREIYHEHTKELAFPYKRKFADKFECPHCKETYIGKCVETRLIPFASPTQHLICHRCGRKTPVSFGKRPIG